MTKGLYILGGPGSGKSTLMARLLRDWSPGPYQRLIDRELFGHIMIGPEFELGVYLGHLRPEYPGTDALSLSVAPHAYRWLQRGPDPMVGYIFGEGARLAHRSFLSELSVRTELLVIHLVVPPEVSESRRATRAGKMLTAQYCVAATTRAENTAIWSREVGIPTLDLDGTKGIEQLVEEISCFQ